MESGRIAGFLASIGTHAALAGAMALFLAGDPPQVEGGAGLSGATTASYDVTLAPVQSRPRPRLPVAPKVDEGIEIPNLATELPAETKNPEPVEAEPPPASEVEARSEGSTAGAAPGRVGQGGSSDEAADRLGNSDRSNAYGLYLQKIQRKIQAAMESPGFLAHEARATLQISIQKDGRVARIEILQSSGDAALDRRAIQAVQKAQPFDPWEREQRVKLPVIFRAN